MLQPRRAAARLARRSYTVPQRSLAQKEPSDSTTSNREVPHQPISEPISGKDSSGTDSGHAASAGTHETTNHDSHPEPVNESLGRGFYIAIGTLAASFALYKLSRNSSSDPATTGDPSAQPLITRMIAYYNYFQDEYARRNAIHTAAVEQAASDRNLFQNSPWTHHIELKFPEKFNSGSPHNVPAGHSADLSAVIAHYEKRNAEKEEKRMVRLRAEEGDSEILAQRQAAEEEERPKSLLERVGLKKPEF